MTKGFVYRTTTNEGLRAKIRIWITILDGEDNPKSFIRIRKTCFASSDSFSEAKRKVGNLYFLDENIVLKCNTFLEIASLIGY